VIDPADARFGILIADVEVCTFLDSHEDTKMKARTDIKPTVEGLSHQWREGHRELNQFFDEYRRWAYEISQRDFPHFGETADRLKQLREELVKHFSSENEISKKMIAARGKPSPEAEANRRQIEADHVNLTSRLDMLISQLGELEPPFDSWQQAVEEVERFCDALEQHEEQESDCIEWLMPKKS
jgi:iron-sulfur cluster repair protein YtfE (RIC family)